MSYEFKMNDDGDWDVFVNGELIDVVEVYPCNIIPNNWPLGCLVEYVSNKNIEKFTVL